MNLSAEFIGQLVLQLIGLAFVMARLSTKIEGRFTRLETHMTHIMGKLGMQPRDL